MPSLSRFRAGTLLTALGACLALGGCHSLFGGSKDDDAPKLLAGDRVPVLEAARKLKADESLSGFTIELPDPLQNAAWPTPGGSVSHAVANALIGPGPQPMWKSDIGKGSGGDYRLLASPVVADGRVYTMDARGTVAAFGAQDGSRKWKFDTTPEDRGTQAVGGGVSFADGTVYASTGFGEVIALSATDGAVQWRRMLGKPLRGAPTVADGRVYVVSIDNELNALSSQDGTVLWHHNGIVESATLMGASSPAVEGDAVIAAYSSGELFSLRAQNGRVAWGEALASPAQVGALPAIADIRGLPVVADNVVYAVSHSDRTGAIDLRSGERLWDVAVGGVNTPALAVNALYLATNENQLMALSRKDGRIIWVADLQRYQKPSDRDSKPVQWWGPVLAGGRLWMTNSIGQLCSFAIDDGAQLTTLNVADRFFIPPVVADNAMFLLADDGELIAVK